MMNKKKKIAILGATGSVGRQTQDVARARGYGVDLLTANADVHGMEDAVRAFAPRIAVMADPAAAADLRVRVADTGTRVLSGEEGILDAIAGTDADTVVNAILGEAGLLPTLTVLDTKKRLALANKESLVIAGEIVMKRAHETGSEILPVDSEHSAIFQSLHAGRRSEIRKILLTASGGPFFGRSREDLDKVTLADTLAHPTWKMGKKITVDSATLMNKGFEVIEAVHLFGVPADRIEVLVHRESILHSAVEYNDHTVIGEFSVPDMRMCVQYAVDYPDRLPGMSEELDLLRVGKLTFAAPDTAAFPLLSLAKQAIGEGGGVPAVLNAADEVAVDAFLHERLSFTGIADVVLFTHDRLAGEAASAHTTEELIAADRRARAVARAYIKEKMH